MYRRDQQGKHISCIRVIRLFRGCFPIEQNSQKNAILRRSWEWGDNSRESQRSEDSRHKFRIQTLKTLIGYIPANHNMQKSEWNLYMNRFKHNEGSKATKLTLPFSSALMSTNSFLLWEPATSRPPVFITNACQIQPSQSSFFKSSKIYSSSSSEPALTSRSEDLVSHWRNNQHTQASITRNPTLTYRKSKTDRKRLSLVYNFLFLLIIFFSEFFTDEIMKESRRRTRILIPPQAKSSPLSIYHAAGPNLKHLERENKEMRECVEMKTRKKEGERIAKKDRDREMEK